jgi:NTE family protein
VFLWFVPANLYAQKVGLVLSGGGPRGVAHVGVLKALEENGIPIDYISGSSMGAIIGGLYASGFSPQEIEQIVASDKMKEWAEGGITSKYRYYFKQPDQNASWHLFKIAIDSVLRLTLPTDISAHYELDYGFMDLFAGASAASSYNFDSLMVPFRCVASDIADNRQIVLREGELGKAVRASSTFPFYFKPVSIDGKLLFDGGMYNNFPVDVLTDEFSPDVVIGSKAASNYGPPKEFDLISQVQTMLMRNTEYSVDTTNGVLIVPKLKTVKVNDFSNSRAFIDSGYYATLHLIPNIKKMVSETVSPEQMEKKRKAFKQKKPELIVGDIETKGLTERQDIYVHKLFKGNKKSGEKESGDFPDGMTLEKLKPLYYQLLGDENVDYVYPNLIFNKETNKYNFVLDMKKEKRVRAELGGLVSSKAINEIFFQMQYKSWRKNALCITGNTYLGSFHNSGYLNARMDFPGKLPFYADISYTLNGWNYFKTKTYFLEDVKPIYLIQNDAFYKTSFGIPVKRSGRLSVEFSNGRKKDKYYQTNQFTRLDTTDVTYFDFNSPAIVFEINSLNHKQYANSGMYFGLSGRFIYGEEENIPGSTSVDINTYLAIHRWFQVRMIYDNYFRTNTKVKFGFYAAATFTNQTAFNNYVSTILAAPAFEPVPESKTIFLPQFRAFNYVAAGVKVVMPIIKNLNFRLEAYGFQPFQEITKDEDNKAAFGEDFSSRYYIGSGNMVYHAPFGPLSMSLNYFDNAEEPWSFSINIGYIIFNKRPY